MINRFIDILKWPLALLAVIILPTLFMELYRVLFFIVTHFKQYLFLFLGLGIYWLAWHVLRGRNWGSTWFATLEHELTHALFATLTLNRVINIRAGWSSGGHIQYKGAGNWLVTVSPYFFPTLALAVVVTACFLGKNFFPSTMLLTGFFLSYHVHSTWRETHGKQTDIQKVGLVFSWMFLPSANLLGYLLVLTLLPVDELYTLSIVKHIYRDLWIFSFLNG